MFFSHTNYEPVGRAFESLRVRFSSLKSSVYSSHHTACKNNNSKCPKSVRAVFILLLILTSSCIYNNRWQELPVCVELTTDQERRVIDAINEHADFDIFIECEGQITISYTSMNLDGSTYNALGAEGIKYSHIRIDPSLNKRMMYLTLMHEFGHALGHSHHTDEGIMAQPIPHESNEVLLEDLIQWVNQEYGDNYE